MNGPFLFYNIPYSPMATNDTIILDGILDDRINLKLPSEKRDEVFEFFATEQILKDFHLSTDDIASGFVDGKDDGGIDVFYIFINGHLLNDTESFFWPKTNIDMEIHIITCKHHGTFKQATFDSMIPTLSDIFDLTKDDDDLKKYNDEVQKKRKILKSAYRKVSPRLTKFSVRISYASRGDTSIIGDSIKSRGGQIKDLIIKSFGNCVPIISYVGSSELIELNRRKPNYSLELTYSQAFGKDDRFVLLTKLSEYKSFITDDQGKLRRYLFDSNVRDFMGLNRVNEDIRASLMSVDSPDFWLLNNGVTILATKAVPLDGRLHIEDIQIVNGLQTTESIYRYFTAGGLDSSQRSVLIKVIVARDLKIRDSIIRATNNQTNVQLAALHATDKIQRDIEELLLRYEIYYERRINYYLNQGISRSMIVSPAYLAAGFVSLVLKAPAKAANLKTRFMKSQSSYDKVFNSNASLEVWPVIAQILLRTDRQLENHRPTQLGSTEHFLKRWRQTLSYLGVSILLRKFDFTINELLTLKLEDFSDDLLTETWLFLQKINQDIISRGQKPGKAMVVRSFGKAKDQFTIEGFENFIARDGDSSVSNIDKVHRRKENRPKKTPSST